MVWKKKSVGLGCNDESRLGFASLWKHQKRLDFQRRGERMGVRTGGGLR
jgi:hypothetical protein